MKEEKRKDDSEEVKRKPAILDSYYINKSRKVDDSCEVV